MFSPLLMLYATFQPLAIVLAKQHRSLVINTAPRKCCMGSILCLGLPVFRKVKDFYCYCMIEMEGQSELLQLLAPIKPIINNRRLALLKSLLTHNLPTFHQGVMTCNTGIVIQR